MFSVHDAYFKIVLTQSHAALSLPIIVYESSFSGEVVYNADEKTRLKFSHSYLIKSAFWCGFSHILRILPQFRAFDLHVEGTYFLGRISNSSVSYPSLN